MNRRLAMIFALCMLVLLIVVLTSYRGNADPRPPTHVVRHYIKVYGEPHLSSVVSSYAIVCMWARYNYVRIILFTYNPKTNYWEKTHEHVAPIYIHKTA